MSLTSGKTLKKNRPGFPKRLNIFFTFSEEPCQRS